MLDLDTPFAHLDRSFAPYMHWITLPSSSPILYVPPNPRPGSPDHRYVFLAYEMPAGEFGMPKGFEHVGKDLMSKANFDLKGFAESAGLKGPVAANWVTVSAREAEKA